MFKPVNRYIAINLGHEKEEEKLVILPEDYKPQQERYVVANVLNSAEDVRFKIPRDSTIVVDASMIEEIKIGGTNYNVILDNYVLGIIE